MFDLDGFLLEDKTKAHGDRGERAVCVCFDGIFFYLIFFLRKILRNSERGREGSCVVML